MGFRDANTAWASTADSTLEERVYYCQNWRADLVALMTSDGHLINQVRYDPYGVPFGIAKSDLEADGDVDTNDYTQYSTYYSGSTMPFADWNWDGTKNTSDITAYLNDKNADSALGRGVLAYMTWSHAGAANRKGYAGYEVDPVLTGSEGWESVYHVRHRVYLSQLGRWARRDPLGYVDGPSLYAYVASMPEIKRDFTGLAKGQGQCDCSHAPPNPCTNCDTCCTPWEHTGDRARAYYADGLYGHCLCKVVRVLKWQRVCENGLIHDPFSESYACDNFSSTEGNTNDVFDTDWFTIFAIPCSIRQCQNAINTDPGLIRPWPNCTEGSCPPPPDDLWIRIPGIKDGGLESQLICPPGWIGKVGKCIKMLFW